jgi:hypothetical protein
MAHRPVWIVLVLLTALSAARVHVWRGGVPLWQNAVAAAPCSLRAHLELGKAYADAQDGRGVRAEWNIVMALARGVPCG